MFQAGTLWVAADTLDDLRQERNWQGTAMPGAATGKNPGKPLDIFGVGAHSDHMTTREEAIKAAIAAEAAAACATEIARINKVRPS